MYLAKRSSQSITTWAFPSILSLESLLTVLFTHEPLPTYGFRFIPRLTMEMETIQAVVLANSGETLGG